MKKNIIKIFVLSFALIIGVGTGLSAQNYYSKPEAIQNLADASKQLNSTLPLLEETNQNAYQVNMEKIRFIAAMLDRLKKGASVAKAVEEALPKEEIYKIQPAVRFVDVSFANTTRNNYIRSEILFLVSY